MELELIAYKYGKYLGGIYIDRVIDALHRDSAHEAVKRILGIDQVDAGDDRSAECLRARAFLEYYRSELARLRGLYGELRSSGVSPSDLAALARRIREARRLAKFYRDLSRECSPQVSDINGQR